MNLLSLTRKTDTEWWIEPHGAMRVPGIIYGSESLVSDMDAKVYEQSPMWPCSLVSSGHPTRCPTPTTAFGLAKDDVVVGVHCGSRGLGHQIGTEFLKKMAIAAPGFGIDVPDRELACAPIESPLGQAHLGAMRGAINCALANRQIITIGARRICHDLPARRVETALRCVAQHLQGRGASSRRNDETAVCAP